MTRPNEPSRPALNRRVIALHLGALLLLALLIYAPWVSVPFPMLDYSEFLQPLRRSTSFAGAFAELAAYYRSHGRTSYLAYLQLAANWSIFGARPAAWNIMVFGYMYAAVAAAWLVLVRAGNTPVTATLAAGLLIVATPAIPGWLRPSGEPLALFFFCIALLAAWSYQRASDWPGRAALISLALLGIGLAKDLLTPLALIPVMVACRGNGFRRPRSSARNVVLIAGAACVILALAIVIVAAQMDRAPNAYTSAYRANNISPEWLVTVFSLMLLPATSAFSLSQMTANLAFVITLIAGWALSSDRTEGSRRRQLAAWLGFIAFGSLLYAPVAWFSPLYGLPFFLGSVMLFAGALSRAADGPATWRRTVRVCATVVLIIAAGHAFNEARTETAERRLNGQISSALRRVPGIDSIMVAVPAVNPWTWAQQSAVLRRYALDRGDLARAEVGTRDVPCGWLPADSALATRNLLINASEKCGALPPAANQLEEAYITLSPLPTKRRLRAQYVLLAPGAVE